MPCGRNVCARCARNRVNPHYSNTGMYSGPCCAASPPYLASPGFQFLEKHSLWFSRQSEVGQVSPYPERTRADIFRSCKIMTSGFFTLASASLALPVDPQLLTEIGHTIAASNPRQGPTCQDAVPLCVIRTFLSL